MKAITGGKKLSIISKY